MVQRAESAGCPVLVWTIDLLAGRNAETTARLARQDTRQCLSCHVTQPIGGSAVVRNRTRPMFAGLSGEMNPPAADWTYVDRLKKMTKMKLLLKGIDTAEDAKLAMEHGADGVIVSNHGGRATETGRAPSIFFPRSSTLCAAGFRYLSMAGSVAAPISTKPWPLAPAPWESAALTSMDCRRLVRKASNVCWKSCARN